MDYMNDNIIPKLDTNESNDSDNDESDNSDSDSNDIPSDIFFRVTDKEGNYVGTYLSTLPQEVAMKAYRKICYNYKQNNIPVPDNITFYVKETINGILLKYIGSREQLAIPCSVTIVDQQTNQKKIITYSYKNCIKRDMTDE